MYDSLTKQCMQINHYDPHVKQSLRAYWQHHHLTRRLFVNDLKKEGIKGKEYSTAVAEWDNINRKSLIDKMRNV